MRNFLSGSRLGALALVWLALGACGDSTLWYEPPPQRRLLPKTTLLRLSPMVAMSDAGASRHFLRDIAPGTEGDAWRWTGQHPAVSLQVHGTSGLKFHIEFTVPDVTFKETGPVTLRFTINDHEVGSVHCDGPGSRVFEAQAPPSWLMPEKINILAADIDKVYVAPADGEKLGFILTNIGLTDR